MTLAQLVPVLLQVSIGLIVFAVGLQSTPGDLTYLLRRRSLLARSVLSMNVVMPLIAAGGRDTVFLELAAPYIWTEAKPPAGYGTHPVVLVTFDDAVAYCRWLSGELQREVRLPTEAEWEKAARGGVDGQRYPWGNDIDPTRGNFLTDPSVKRQRGTRPTGTYAPNPYGLYDMCGNVWEWVSDWYAADYYGSGQVRDPGGPGSGDMRIVRGGAWVNDDVSMLRCSHRHKVPPDTYAYSVGFRITCSA